MINVIKKLVVLIFITIVIGGMLFAGTSYFKYTNLLNERPLNIVIDEVKSQDSYVSIDDVSQIYLDAVVAVEDRRFYEHNGVDLRSLGRAVFANIEAKGYAQGGSTITQQIMKNLYFSHEKTLTRKMMEVFAARDLEENSTKEEILELYINIAYFGDGHYGIGEASKGYFEKLPRELSYNEATLLAGLPQAPSRYALSKNMDRAVERQKQVIAALETYEN